MYNTSSPCSPVYGFVKQKQKTKKLTKKEHGEQKQEMGGDLVSI
jgi:hypothetical protein